MRRPISQWAIFRLSSLWEAMILWITVACFAAKTLVVLRSGAPLADVVVYAVASAVLGLFALNYGLRYHEEVQALRRASEAAPDSSGKR